jgi:hypothetical protein
MSGAATSNLSSTWRVMPWALLTSYTEVVYALRDRRGEQPSAAGLVSRVVMMPAPADSRRW